MVLAAEPLPCVVRKDRWDLLLLKLKLYSLHFLASGVVLALLVMAEARGETADSAPGAFGKKEGRCQAEVRPSGQSWATLTLLAPLTVPSGQPPSLIIFFSARY